MVTKRREDLLDGPPERVALDATLHLKNGNLPRGLNAEKTCEEFAKNVRFCQRSKAAATAGACSRI
jgi:hypothetical protein